MKVLFVWDSPEYLRFYDSAIEECAARGHDVAIAVINAPTSRSRSASGPDGVRRARARAGTRAAARGQVGHRIADGLRGDDGFRPLPAPALCHGHAQLRARMKRKVLPWRYHWIDRIPRLRRCSVRARRACLDGGGARDPGAPADRRLPPRAKRPTSCSCRRSIDAASEQVDWIKAARVCGIRSAACVASWDNLTNKGLMRIEPDLVDRLERGAEARGAGVPLHPGGQDRDDGRAVVRQVVLNGR